MFLMPAKSQRCVAWSADGRILATGANDETIRLSDGNSGKSIRDLVGHTGPIYSVTWSPEDHYLASGSFDGSIRLWDGQNQWQSQELRGHQDWVMSLDWSPDGKILAAGSRDKTISFWDVRHKRTLPSRDCQSCNLVTRRHVIGLCF